MFKRLHGSTANAPMTQTTACSMRKPERLTPLIRSTHILIRIGSLFDRNAELMSSAQWPIWITQGRATDLHRIGLPVTSDLL